ncbi:magnesium-dependent phosphatase-1, partial [Dipodascopsis tothii]|uniref:magnesium-dependent phosphatase-1 n=1 Tax=Dipodascopsis tothii TaxID=44089 RepID=UPI0034CFF4A4
SEEYPKIVVFDLDYTLWPCWCDTHISPPVKKHGTDNAVVDKHGRSMAFFPDVESVISELRTRGIQVAAASRTDTPLVAKKMLKLLTVAGQSSIDQFDVLEIYPGSKITHFKQIAAKTGIDYSDMLFFDDETRNREVERVLGVKFVLVDDGVTRPVWEQAVVDWRRHKAAARR